MWGRYLPHIPPLSLASSQMKGNFSRPLMARIPYNLPRDQTLPVRMADDPRGYIGGTQKMNYRKPCYPRKV